MPERGVFSRGHEPRLDLDAGVRPPEPAQELCARAGLEARVVHAPAEAPALVLEVDVGGPGGARGADVVVADLAELIAAQ